MGHATETAGALLRQARVAAGLSQAELAARAGVTQSVISAYESGHRQPALRTLAALIAAAAAHGVTNLRVFGSVARGTDRPDSDLDLLADLPPDMGLLGLGRVQAELEAIVGSQVDLVPADDLKPGVRA